MSKVIFEFDGTKDTYDIALCTHRIQMGMMLQDIQNYARELRKYEERKEIPTNEVESKLNEIIDDWYHIQDC